MTYFLGGRCQKAMFCVWFEDCYRGASWTGSLLCPCSGTVTEQPAGQAVYCVYVQGQADYSVFIQCYSQRSQLDRQFTVSISGTVTEQPAGQGYSGSLLIVHVQGQAVYCVHVQGLLQRSQLDRQFTKCPCSGTATAKGASWTVYCVHVQGLFQRSQLDRQFTKCPCSRTSSLLCGSSTMRGRVQELCKS